MLAIQEGQYTYPVYIEEEEDNIFIYVGNAKRTMSPCICISIYKKRYVVLQDLIYLPHCSVCNKRIKKGDDSVVMMLQSVLKWLIRKYDFVKYIQLTDKSTFTTEFGEIRLAEKGMLTEGKTWYMKHFGAIPTSGEAIAAFANFKSTYKKYKDELSVLDDKAWLYENIRELYTKYPLIKNQVLYGTTWKISRKTIETYDVNPVDIQIGGGRNTGLKLKQLYDDNVQHVFTKRIFI